MNLYFKKDRRGIAVLLTVLILSSILLISLGISEILQRNLRAAKISSYSPPAYLAAESGAERVLWEVRKNNSANMSIGVDNSVSFDPAITFNSANISVIADSVTEVVGELEYTTVTLKGKYYDAQRSITVRYQLYE